MKSSIETKNLERLRDSCYKKDGENKTIKTKTATILPIISNNSYKRKPQSNILRTSKKETKTIIIARYGVLECGKNYKGTQKEICDQCNCTDNESHRLNFCIKFKSTNLYECNKKLNYDEIYSDNIADIRSVTAIIEKIWNTNTASGSIRTE